MIKSPMAEFVSEIFCRLDDTETDLTQQKRSQPESHCCSINDLKL